MSSLKYWVWLASLRGVGAVTAAVLLRRFGSPEQVFYADAASLREVEGVKQKDIAALTAKDSSGADKTLASCDEIGCRIITLRDAAYPDRLRNIYDPPIVLYVKGRLPVIDDEAAVGIVGTRNCTPYGLRQAENIALTLASSGLIVVTGLARGIDSAAAKGALRGGGRVVGVIGSGVDVIYPPENRGLFEDVARSGAIVSEYPPGTAALAAHFPMRNRILSGLSLGVAVIEAPKRSGALITASRALEQGRDVFALPGNVDAVNSEGSNRLLREGAIPVLSGDDIVDEYADLFPDKIIVSDRSPAAPQDRRRTAPPKVTAVSRERETRPDSSDGGEIGIDKQKGTGYIDIVKIAAELDGDEKTVAEAIGTGTVHIDDIIVNTGLPAQKVLTALTMLEIKGYASCGSGKHFSLTWGAAPHPVG